MIFLFCLNGFLASICSLPIWNRLKPNWISCLITCKLLKLRRSWADSNLWTIGPSDPTLCLAPSPLYSTLFNEEVCLWWMTGNSKMKQRSVIKGGLCDNKDTIRRRFSHSIGFLFLFSKIIMDWAKRDETLLQKKQNPLHE